MFNDPISFNLARLTMSDHVLLVVSFYGCFLNRQQNYDGPTDHPTFMCLLLNCMLIFVFTIKCVVPF